MRILVIHQYYLRPDWPGGSRFNELSRLWTRMGHEVTVVTGQVNYAVAAKPAEYRGKWIVEEDDEGVRVLRCFTPEFFHKSFAWRAAAFAAFMASSLDAALGAAGRHDVVIATSPPLTVALPGMIAAGLRRLPFCFEVRDLWPESAVSTGVLSPNGFLTKTLSRFEALAYGRADAINVLTPAFKENILKRGLADEKKISIVPNGADLDLFRPGRRDNEVRRRLGWGKKFVVLYAGAHGRANRLIQFVEAAERLRGREDILLASVGAGPDLAMLKGEVDRRGLGNMVFLGPVDKEEMPGYVDACDAGAAILQRNETFKTVYPNKIFDYMASARPTLVAIDGAARRLVEEAGAGLYAEPENAEELAEKIAWFADHREESAGMGERGRAFVEANFSREVLADKYIEVLSGISCGP